MDDNTKIAPCGIDCKTCDVYLATVHHDEQLRAKTAALWSQLNGCDIPVEALFCEGCRADGVKTYYCTELCAIRKCAAEKGCETCGRCAALDSCEVVKPILDNHAGARENLLCERSGSGGL